MLYVVTLFLLAISAFCIWKKANTSTADLANTQFTKLQQCYLLPYYLATFADWLQGPYLYQVYSDYGYGPSTIAMLYIVGFASSGFCGLFIGHLGDRYGRKALCTSFGIMYSICCLTKLSPNIAVLLTGRFISGICTSILFTTFESWYINEHLHHFNLPPEWINLTFTKSTFYTGLLAIFAGVVSQIAVEVLNFGSVSPYLLSIPILLFSSYMIQTTWDEHLFQQQVSQTTFKMIYAPLQLILCKDNLLLILGFIQSVFEAVMYTFVFSWTPVLVEIDPPLGLVFSCFMISIMIGSEIYSLLIIRRYQAQNILTAAMIIAFLSLTTVALIITTMLQPDSSGTIPSIICLFSFIIFEVSIGMYSPVIGYLRSRTIPEEYRVTVTNIFRVPMNVFTCASLMLQHSSGTSDSKNVQRFQKIFLLCSFSLFLSVIASFVFARRYTMRMSREDSLHQDTIMISKLPEIIELGHEAKPIKGLQIHGALP